MRTTASDASPRSDLPIGMAFVLVWCTGYIAGKVVVAHAAPFTSLVWRFGLAALVFAVLAWRAGAWRCTRWQAWHAAVTGVLMLAMQFGGVYAAFALGAHAGVTALAIGAMPLTVALAATLSGMERLRLLNWAGMVLGLAGVGLVVADRVDGATSWAAWGALLLGLAGITAGTLYQKRHAVSQDLRLGLAIQNAAAVLVLLPLAAWEGFAFDRTGAFWASMAWMVLVNSVGGFALLFVLIRHGAASRVAALFFLVPPVTAVMGQVAFGEHLTWLKVAGFALASLGVWLATRRD